MVTLSGANQLSGMVFLVGTRRSFPDCLLIVHRRTRTHSPHPPPRPGHSFPDCMLILHMNTLAASSSLAWLVVP